MNKLSNEYLLFLASEITETLNTFKLISLRETEFYFQEKTIISEFSGFDMTYHSIDEVPSRYFNEIVSYSQIKYNICLKFISGINDIISENNSFSNNKLVLKLTVADIALLFRLLDDEKIFKCDQKTEIFRFVSNSFSTEKQSDISESNIKNKFYTPDSNAIDTIDELLIHLKQTLNKLK